MYDTEIRDEFQQSSLSYEAYIYGRYDPRPEVASARVRRADLPLINRGGAVAATRISSRGDEPAAATRIYEKRSAKTP